MSTAQHLLNICSTWSTSLQGKGFRRWLLVLGIIPGIVIGLVICRSLGDRKPDRPETIAMQGIEDYYNNRSPMT
ncbi:MAG: hypothetical protein LVS60_05620 [Nodosilinea sp. LVE1205-7]